MHDLWDIVSATVDTEAAEAAVRAFLLADKERTFSLFAWELGLNEEDIDIDDGSTQADFDEFVNGLAAEQVSDAIHRVSFCVRQQDGRVLLWRAISVSPDFLETDFTERPIGIYWAYLREAADPHWGDFSNGKTSLILEGVVNIDDIDWQRTIELNAHSEDEHEIRLKTTATVFLLSACWGHHGEPIALDVEIPAGTSVSQPAPAP